jgi:hypothetical protein
MKTLLYIVTAMVLVSLTCIKASSQQKTEIAIETDPSTFLLKGYSFHLRIKPADCEKFLIGAGTYGLDLPEMMVDLNKDNRDEGWDVRIRNAYSLFGEFYFKKANHGWFIGEQAGMQNFNVTNDNEGTGDKARFSNLLLMTYLGYSWHPGKGAFYIKPWAGLGYTRKISGSTDVGTMRYDVAPIFPFVTFHVGYTF